MVKNKNIEGLIVYQSKDGALEVKAMIQEDSIWLSQDQLAKLFQTTKQNISLHLKNVFISGELAEKSVVKDFLTTASDGKRYKVVHYGLDAIISVGYRINSKKATQFRIWATKTLKEHLLRGYTINQKVLQSQRSKFKELQTTIEYLENQAKHELLRGQGEELLSLVRDYTKSLHLLEDYDNKKIKSKRGNKTINPLSIEWANKVIVGIKQNITDTGRSLGMLGIDINRKLDSVLNNINQSFSGKDLYPTIEDKSSNLLYFTIKDHPFLDGNKRIASILFIAFLDRNNYLYRENGERKINDNALVALALLVAVSNPEEKDLIIDLIKSLLA